MTARRAPARGGSRNGVGKDIPSLANRTRRDNPKDRAAGVTAFAEAWASALAGTSYVRLTGAEVDARLRNLTVRLGAVVNDDPFDPAPAAAIGADLVATDFTAPEALGRTIGLIYQRLLTDLEPDVITPRYENPIRLAALLDKVSTGFTRALRARTLDEQEEIRQAALAASAHMRQELLYSALHDPLTGLANRALMMDHLAKFVAAPLPDARLGLCVIGLDTFRDVTESLGHQVGDKVLKVVAERLDHVIAGAGHLVAHIGGHRFAFLVEGTTCADDVVKVADEALSALDAPIRVDAHELPIAACAGIVERPAAGSEPAELMRAADMTLHWARTDNRGRLAVFDVERNAHEVARYRLSAAMPAALERGEFVLEYQPLVRLSDGTLRGVEALARWRHPELGLLAPDRFIELAEDTGLIVPLGLRLLEEACRQTVEWHEHTADPPFVSVNLAARQLHQPSLVADVAAILDRTKLRPRFLQLEITESDIIGTDEHTLGILRALGNLGIRLAIDDFGTGYANIACLPDLPVNSIKLAGNFVARLSPEVERDDTAESILGMLVKLGHMLKMSVTAEGIETPSQERRLTAIGCDLGQGWQFGRPGDAEQISNLLIARPTR
jgi:diguanylate cyclase (GGDEF)-like protein